MYRALLSSRAALIFFASSLVSTAGAAAIYDNGPSTYSGGIAIGHFIAADDFVLTADGTLTGVSVDINDGPASQNRRWDGTVEWWILSDNAGAPGSVIASGNGQNIAASNIVVDALGFRTLTVDFDLGQSIPIDGLTPYWLALHFQTDYSRVSVFWDHSSTIHYSHAYQGIEELGGVPDYSGSYFGMSGFDAAFRLEGSSSAITTLVRTVGSGSGPSEIWYIDPVLCKTIFIGETGTSGLGSMSEYASGFVYSVNWDGELVTVDPFSGAATVLGALTGITSPSIRGLSRGTGPNLLAIQSSVSAQDPATDRVYSIDPTTREATLIGDTHLGGLQSLTVASDGTLYSWDCGGNPYASFGLLTINPSTGAATDVDPSDTYDFKAELQTLAFAPDGTLYGIGSGNVYTVDRATGDESLLCFGITQGNGIGSTFIEAQWPLDADGDHYPAPADCDDGDPYRFPGNPEICDQKDNNCDGNIDEGIPPVDADGDGLPAFDSCAVAPYDCDDSDFDPTNSCNTAPGQGPMTFSDSSGRASVTFDDVTSLGDTSLAEILGCMLDVPQGFSLNLSNLCYDIGTTAGFTPPATICITVDVDDIPNPPGVLALRVLHCNATGGSCVPLDPRSFVTNDTIPPSVTVCADTDGFSRFALAVDTKATDADFDGYYDSIDNCPSAFNPSQTDADSDARGDACDNCATTPNGPIAGTCISGPLLSLGQACLENADCGTGGFCSLSQEDANQNGRGDACDVSVVPAATPDAFGTPDCFFQGICTPDDFPIDWGVVRTFTYGLAPDDNIYDVLINGTWGGDVFGGTAPIEVYLEGILVAECVAGDPCWDNASTVEWNEGKGVRLGSLGVDFGDPAVQALFEDGSADLSVIQNDEISVNISDLRLRLYLPEPSLAPGLIAGALLLVAASARRRNAKTRHRS